MVAREQKNGLFEDQIYADSIISIETVHYRRREATARLVPICVLMLL